MDQIRNQNDRYRKIGNNTVSLLYQGKQPELGDSEVYDTTDQRRDDFPL